MATGYERIIGEMKDIAEIVQLFPDSLQLHVFNTLIAELTNHKPLITEDTMSIQNREVPSDSLNLSNSTQDYSSHPSENQGKTLSDFFEENFARIQNLKQVEFASLVAFYYEAIAPIEQRKSEINSAILGDAFETANKAPPSHPNMTLNNAKRSKYNYMKSGSTKGYFKLTPTGRHYIKNNILAAQNDND